MELCPKSVLTYVDQVMGDDSSYDEQGKILVFEPGDHEPLLILRPYIDLEFTQETDEEDGDE